MFKILFLLFIVIPIIEIAVIMQVGAILGAWPTVAIVILTAWLGAKNVKQQGIATIQSLQNKMAQGEAPSDEIVAGLLLLVAGVLLVTPGFVTDIFGLSLLVPQCRKLLINSVRSHLTVSNFGTGQSFSFHSQSFNSQHQGHTAFDNESPGAGEKLHKGKTIDGEFERKE
ncbi:membrane protein FxsA [Thalassotalea insulae]|uniref:Membrane protein FxsA n=1 Tax=Thalassotalea insulae TaxID=2056778 RepID=A0ABQ6GWT0_9GAMM|nr:FxsA family protein [Thalassotalea insulae]GLX78970.1 membrane protein FxsA [Thalassotalea insulae]